MCFRCFGLTIIITRRRLFAVRPRLVLVPVRVISTGGWNHSTVLERSDTRERFTIARYVGPACDREFMYEIELR